MGACSHPVWSSSLSRLLHLVWLPGKAVKRSTLPGPGTRDATGTRRGCGSHGERHPPPASLSGCLAGRRAVTGTRVLSFLSFFGVGLLQHVGPKPVRVGQGTHVPACVQVPLVRTHSGATAVPNSLVSVAADIQRKRERERERERQIEREIQTDTRAAKMVQTQEARTGVLWRQEMLLLRRLPGLVAAPAPGPSGATQAWLVVKCFAW